MTSFQISLSIVDELEMFVMKKKKGWSGRKGGEKLVKKVNGVISVQSPILQGLYHLSHQGTLYDQPRQHIKKQRHYFVNKGLYSQSYSFSHTWIWEVDHKEGWAPKNWCFWTVEKTLESPLDCEEIQPVHSKGNQSWIFFGRTDAEAETPTLWPPDAKNWLFKKTLMLGKIEGRRKRGQQRMRWLDGIADSMDMSLSKLQKRVKGREAWHTAVHGSQRVRYNLVT